MNRTVRPGQLVTVLVLSAAAGLLPGTGSLTAICLGAALLGVLLLPFFWARGRRRPLPPSVRAWGAGVLALYLLAETALSAAALGTFAAHTEQSPDLLPVLIGLLIPAAVYGGAMGLPAHARAAGLWTGAGILLLTVTALLLLPEVSFARLGHAFQSPAPTEGFRFAAGLGGEWLLLALFFREVPDFRPRHACFFLLSVIGLGLLCTGLARSVLGDWAAARTEPLYTALLALSPETAFRPEGLYTILRIAAVYGRAAALLLGVQHCLRKLPVRRPVWLLSAAGIAAGTAGMVLVPRPETAALLARLLQPWGLALGTALPLLTTGRDRP